MSDEPRKEFIRYMAAHLRLQLDADELPILEQVVEANEEYLVIVDATDPYTGRRPAWLSCASCTPWRQSDER